MPIFVKLEGRELTLLSMLFRPKKPEVWDPNPDEIDVLPARPYRVLHADLPFYSDPQCKTEVKGVRLIVLRCEDPKQSHETLECMPTRKNYKAGQLVKWHLNNKKTWEVSWYKNPNTGNCEKAWTMAVEFIGGVFRTDKAEAIAKDH